MAIFSLINRCHRLCFRFVEEFQKVLSVLVPEHRLGKCAQLVRRDPPVAVGDAFQTGDLKSLTLLDDLHEDRGLGQGVVRARAEASAPSARRFAGNTGSRS